MDVGNSIRLRSYTRPWKVGLISGNTNFCFTLGFINRHFATITNHRSHTLKSTTTNVCSTICCCIYAQGGAFGSVAASVDIGCTNVRYRTTTLIAYFYVIVQFDS